MLQKFITNVSSVFFGRMLQSVYLNIAYVSHICCMCFIWILRMFAMVFKYFQVIFSSVLEAAFNCFICLRRMLQVLHLDISKIDRMLHLSSSSSAASPRYLLLLLLAPVGHPPPHPPLLDAGDVWGSAGPAWACKTDCGARAASIRALASSFLETISSREPRYKEM
jgi:hypothetical protein